MCGLPFSRVVKLSCSPFLKKKKKKKPRPVEFFFFLSLFSFPGPLGQEQWTRSNLGQEVWLKQEVLILKAWQLNATMHTYD